MGTATQAAQNPAIVRDVLRAVSKPVGVEGDIPAEIQI